MEGQVSAEQRHQTIIDRAWFKYLISIWNNVILFFLIDLLFGLLIVVIVYVLMLAIFWLGQPWNIVPVGYINKTITAFCIVYILALAIVAGWHHFQNIMRREKHIPEGGNASKDKESHDLSVGAE